MQSADFLSAVFFYLKVGENLNQNWIVENLNNAFSTWNGKLGELWGLVTTGPQTFKGGAVWSVMQTLHNGMVGIGYALVVLFFAISLCKNTMNFHELKRPEAAIHYFLRFVAAKALVGYGMDIMLNVFSICNGIVTDMADSMGGISEAMVSLPAEMQTAIENVGFLASIPLWLVTILGSLFITVLSFVMILTVYGRFFRLYMSGIKAKRKQLVRKTLMRAKAQGERAAEQRQELPEEYAQTEVQQGISDVAARTGNTAKSTTRISYRKFRAMQEKRKNLTLQGSTQSASKPTEKEKVTVPTQTERREMFKKKRFRQKAIAAKTPAPQAPVPSSATPAPPPYQAQMQQHLKRQHLTREAVRRYLQKQTATTAAGNTAPIVTHAPKLPTISSKQATVEAISRGVHYIAAKIKALLSQTVRHAAQSLLALLGAGGVVLLLAMVIGAAAAVIGSPMGILFADESGDPNSIPIAEIVADTNADFGAAVNDIVSAHPECSETTITYDYEDGHTWASYWPEVLAIFAVHTNLNSDSDVVVINAAQMQRIQDTFWAMHEITYEVEEVDTTPEPTEDDPDPEQQTDYILHITVSSKTVDELAELYNFTQDQKDILHQLLSEEMRPSLLALCGGIAVADGELCWPLPGHTYISCHFGEVDAFGNAGHRGTDIPAPEGTPILAAHSGTVLVSGWNDSYGNQVLLDNGAGLSTRYAHMTQTAVTAGEAVTAGQIIGYVGSTGDSTGNHLHFEVMQNGVRMNPLELVFAQ